MDTLLELKRVTKYFEKPGGDGRYTVMEDVSLAVASGESIAVTGPSGSGKSTLLHLVAGLDHPSSGSVRVDGQELAGLPESRLTAIRRQDIGIVFQLHHLLPQCTVLENVMLPTLAVRPVRDGSGARRRALRLLDRVGLADRWRHRPGQLSGGECQRVAVARALVNGPRLLLADEPTGALDAETATHLADLLLEFHREEHLTLVVVTHWPELAQRLDRRYRLGNARLEPWDQQTPEAATGCARN